MAHTFRLVGIPGAVVLQLLLVATGYVEWHLATAEAPPGSISLGLVVQAIGLPILASLPLWLLAFLVVTYAYRHSVQPLLNLARVADRIARRDRSPVPLVERVDEIGDLARLLAGWQSASMERDALIERAPIGICQADVDGRLQDVNLAASEMLGYPREELLGRDLLELLPQADQAAGREVRERARSQLRDRGRSNGLDQTTFQCRFVRADGRRIWCSVTVAPIDHRDGRAQSYILLLEDITERRRQAEHAALIQSQLLPRTPPRLAGYQLAGACLPARVVAGDLYDWVLTPDGHLDLTVADVMGKGMAAALVMARLRTALRRAPQELGPSARVAAGDAAVTFDMDGAEPFVTLFHARLHPGTGVLRYVDAGHGYSAIVHANGTHTRLTSTCLPLGLGLGEGFPEATVALRPGDALLVHSDGLVEVGSGTRSMGDLVEAMRTEGDADCAVTRLVDGVAAERPDDVTVLVLRRLGELQ